MELDVAERLPRAGQRDLALGGAVGVVERRLGRASLGDRAQVLDGVAPWPAAGGRVQTRLLELQQRAQVAGLGQCRFDHGSVLGGARWAVIGWVRATSARRSSRLPGSGARRARLHQHVAQRRRLDRPGEHRQPEPVGDQPGTAARSATRRRRCARADVAARTARRPVRARAAYAAARLSTMQRTSAARVRPARRRRARGTSAAIRAGMSPGGEEARVLHVEHRHRAVVRRARCGEQPAARGPLAHPRSAASR